MVDKVKKKVLRYKKEIMAIFLISSSPDINSLSILCLSTASVVVFNNASFSPNPFLSHNQMYAHHPAK